MKMFWSVRKLVLGSVVCLCWCLSGSNAYSEPLKVVATNSIVADWVSNVTAGSVDMTVLVGPNGDMHTFEPTPQDNVTLSQADLIFEMGLGLEHWMGKLYAASGSKAKRITLTRGVVEQPLGAMAHDHHSHDHAHEVDPHVWHNVRYVIGMVKRISEAFKKVDPGQAGVYEANTQKYIKELEDLDRWVMRVISEIPRSERKIVTNHDNLSYYCERYQLILVGTAFKSFTTEADDPSAKDIARLIFQIKQTGVGAVFAENIQSSKLLASLAQEANVQLAPPLYTDALGGKDSPADTYIHMIRYNTDTIVKALKGRDEALHHLYK